MQGAQRNLQVLGVDAQTRQRAPGLEYTQRLLEGGLGAQRLDCRIHAAAAGDLEDFLDHVHIAEIQRHVGPHLPGDGQAFLDPVDDDDAAGTTQPGTCRRAETDRALGEDRHDVADPDVGLFRAAKSGGHDVRTHQHLFVRQAVRYRRQVRLGIRYQHVLGLGAVDGIAEAPAAHRLVAVAAAGAAILGGNAVLAGVGGEAGTDGAGDHALAFLVALHVAAELLDDAHRFVSDGQACRHRVLTLEDMHVGAADGGRGDAQQRVVGADLGDGLVL